MCSAHGSTAHTSTPGTRARCAAYRLPIAPQPSTATRTGWSSVTTGRPRPRASAQTRGSAAADAEAADHPAVDDERHSPGGRQERRRVQGAPGQRRRRRTPRATSPLAHAEPRRRRGRGQRHVDPGGDPVVHPVLLDRVAAAVDDGDRHPQPAGRAPQPAPRSHSARAQASSCWRARGRRRLHAQAVLGRHDEVAEPGLPAGLVVAVLADVGDAEGVGDQQVLGVGRLAVGADHLGRHAGRQERADRRAGGGDPADDDAVASSTGMPPAPGNTASRRDLRRSRPRSAPAGVVIRCRCSVLGICWVAEIHALDARAGHAARARRGRAGRP